MTNNISITVICIMYNVYMCTTYCGVYVDPVRIRFNSKL